MRLGLAVARIQVKAFTGGGAVIPTSLLPLPFLKLDESENPKAANSDEARDFRCDPRGEIQDCHAGGKQAALSKVS
jgi:hypothetical protein